MNRIIRPTLLFLILIFTASCAERVELQKETDERAYRRGKSLLREGRKDEALEAFLSMIAARPDAAESHLESGLLYLNHIKDPLAAIYHFRQYLAMKPNAEYSSFVEELILTAKKDFAASLPGQPFVEEVKRVDLMEKLKEQERINNEVKTELIETQRQLAAAEADLARYQNQLAVARTQRTNNQAVAPIVIEDNRPNTNTNAGTPGVYTVVSGDTLSRVSQKVYGSSTRWMDIFQANRDVLPSPNSLKPGQELRIP